MSNNNDDLDKNLILNDTNKNDQTYNTLNEQNSEVPNEQPNKINNNDEIKIEVIESLDRKTIPERVEYSRKILYLMIGQTLFSFAFSLIALSPDVHNMTYKQDQKGMLIREGDGYIEIQPYQRLWYVLLTGLVLYVIGGITFYFQPSIFKISPPKYILFAVNALGIGFLALYLSAGFFYRIWFALQLSILFCYLVILITSFIFPKEPKYTAPMVTAQLITCILFICSGVIVHKFFGVEFTVTNIIAGVSGLCVNAYIVTAYWYIIHDLANTQNNKDIIYSSFIFYYFLICLITLQFGEVEKIKETDQNAPETADNNQNNPNIQSNDNTGLNQNPSNRV